MRRGRRSSHSSGGKSDTGRPLKKGPWTAEEDKILRNYVTLNGEGNWNVVQDHCGLSRCGKSCRLRWVNHLRPNLKKGAFTPAEERAVVELHASMGNKWARMATEIRGRTDNEIKNFWNTRAKRLQRAGKPLYPDDVRQRMMNGAQIGQNINDLGRNENPSSSSTNPATFTIPEVHFENLSHRYPYRALFMRNHPHPPPELIPMPPNNPTIGPWNSRSQISASDAHLTDPTSLYLPNLPLENVAAAGVDLLGTDLSYLTVQNAHEQSPFPLTMESESQLPGYVTYPSTPSLPLLDEEMNSEPLPFPTFDCRDADMETTDLDPNAGLDSIDAYIQSPQTGQLLSDIALLETNALLGSIVFQSNGLANTVDSPGMNQPVDMEANPLLFQQSAQFINFNVGLSGNQTAANLEHEENESNPFIGEDSLRAMLEGWDS